MTDNITLLGVLFLGGFVGFILGGTLRLTNVIPVKVAVSILGAALGGVPVAFMSGLTYQKWMYPIGLVFGLLWIRVVYARYEKQGRSRVLILAWIDVIAIISATLVVVILTAFIKFGK
jgi:hypothetical protein